MISLKKGDIFEEIDNNDFIIIYGHLGLNELNFYWKQFQQKNNFDLPSNPFHSNQSKFFVNNKHIWFISGHGLSDVSSNDLVEEIIQFAVNNKLQNVAYNGAQDMNTGIGLEKQKSDKNRSINIYNQFMKQIDSLKFNGTVSLVSISDSFIEIEEYLVQNN